MTLPDKVWEDGEQLHFSPLVSGVVKPHQGGRRKGWVVGPLQLFISCGLGAAALILCASVKWNSLCCLPALRWLQVSNGDSQVWKHFEKLKKKICDWGVWWWCRWWWSLRIPGVKKKKKNMWRKRCLANSLWKRQSQVLQESCQLAITKNKIISLVAWSQGSLQCPFFFFCGTWSHF